MMRKKISEKELKIRDVLIHYGFKQTGRDYGRVSVLCPFHDDNNKSAVVDYDTQSFCCFACDVKGDGLDLIQYKEGVGFSEAVSIAQRVFNTSSPTIRKGRGQSVVLFGRERSIPRGRKSIPSGRRGRTIAES